MPRRARKWRPKPIPPKKAAKLKREARADAKRARKAFDRAEKARTCQGAINALASASVSLDEAFRSNQGVRDPSISKSLTALSKRHARVRRRVWRSKCFVGGR